jgi:hypothetical protein
MNTVTTHSANDGRWARGLYALLGIWLIISAYFWPHVVGQVTNAWIVGILAIVLSAIATYSSPQARYGNTVLGVWLFLSAFIVVGTTTATMWNNVIVGVLMFLFSLVPSRSTARTPAFAR